MRIVLHASKHTELCARVRRKTGRMRAADHVYMHAYIHTYTLTELRARVRRKTGRVHAADHVAQDWHGGQAIEALPSQRLVTKRVMQFCMYVSMYAT